MSSSNTRRVPSHTFLCCIPVRVGVVVSFVFYCTYYSANACGLVPFPSWRLRRHCSDGLCDYPDEALTYDCLSISLLRMPDSPEIFSWYHWKQGCFDNPNCRIHFVGNPLLLWVRLCACFMISLFHSQASQFDWSYFTKALIRPIILVDGCGAPSVKHWLGYIRYLSQL